MKMGITKNTESLGKLSKRIKTVIPEWRELEIDEVRVGYDLIKKIQSAYRNPKYRDICTKIANSCHHRTALVRNLEALEQMQGSDPLWDLIQIFFQFRGLAFSIIAKNIRRSLLALEIEENKNSKEGIIAGTIGKQRNRTHQQIQDAL